MKAQEISAGIYCIHADICARTSRFEGLWMLPQGVSINSYIVKGEKTALIDIVRDWDGSLKSYTEQLESIGLSFKDIDYLILNHLEPDHCDLIEYVHSCNPQAEVISTSKGLAIVEKFFKVQGNLRAVKTGDCLDLGGGKVLQFYETPNVHWPETMMTYDPAAKVLFSCDAFGSYGAIGEKIFDDQHSEEELKFYEAEALRYYSNIVASFSTFVLKALDKLAALDIKCIAPSHGLIWRSHPGRISSLYKRFAGYNTGGKCEKEICIIWGSMYGYTKQGLDAVSKALKPNKSPTLSTTYPTQTYLTFSVMHTKRQAWCLRCRPMNTRCSRRWHTYWIYLNASTLPIKQYCVSETGDGRAAQRKNTSKKQPL